LNIQNSKHQIANNKWFDKLTTLSQTEGQYPNFILETKIRLDQYEFCILHAGRYTKAAIINRFPGSSPEFVRIHNSLEK